MAKKLLDDERKQATFRKAANAEAEQILRKAMLEAKRVSSESIEHAKALAADASSVENQIQELRGSYVRKREQYDRLIKEVAILDDKVAFAEMGVYDPHFDFTDSEQFKTEIAKVREEQKRLIALESAVSCSTNWTVEGSASKGATMTKRNIKLTLRAFNGECDVAIANVRWNNAVAMEKRIVRAAEQIDKLNASNHIKISTHFANLKVRELQLTHECREKLKQEREERAEAARLAREELKLVRDLERAQEEEERYTDLLAKAKAEAASISGRKLEAFNEQIAMLEKDLAQARAKSQRAQAMAERTTSGYVYVISNVGSFGPDMIKIGLTRRLDPMDRVRELGDASVPFLFDTHAVIYSDNAPALERSLHAEFEHARVNTQNYRREFFRVGLVDVERALQKLAPNAPFFRDIEAQEYRETVANRQVTLLAIPDDQELPIAI